MKNFFAVRTHKLDTDVVFLLFRLMLAWVFIFAGWGKMHNPMGWMGSTDVFPGFMQLLAAMAELGGGILLLLGLMTRLGALALAFTMVGAIYFHKFVMGDPFINTQGGGSYQVAAAYLLMLILLAVAGPGRFAADTLLFGRKA